MAGGAISVGILLTIMGVGSYFGTGMVSVTALIPAFFGIPIAVLGQVAKNEAHRKHAMHGAVVLAVLGFFGAAPGLLKIPVLFSGDAVRPVAILMQCLMAVVLAIFVMFCVRSFIAARSGSASS